MSDTVSVAQLVVVGASAGGIEALSTLVATLNTPFPAPIVIAQHLDPNRPCHLEAILARRTPPRWLPCKIMRRYTAAPSMSCRPTTISRLRIMM